MTIENPANTTFCWIYLYQSLANNDFVSVSTFSNEISCLHRIHVAYQSALHTNNTFTRIRINILYNIYIYIYIYIYMYITETTIHQHITVINLLC